MGLDHLLIKQGVSQFVDPHLDTDLIKKKKILRGYAIDLTTFL